MENPQLALAQKLIETTGTHLFLTGKAGTGKTTFLHNLKKHTQKRLVIAAPTGIAAINAGGVTLHSLFQLPFTPYFPGYSQQNEAERHRVRREKINLIRSIDLLVIDEISMVRADLLDAVDDALRWMRNRHQPFGGVQLLLIGDLQQLAPVAKDEEWALLRKYYETPYFFSSHALATTTFTTIELTHVYRQKDEHFLQILNRVREGKADEETLKVINSRYEPAAKPEQMEGYIHLVTHNAQAGQINHARLTALAGTLRTYAAEVSGNFPESSYPTDKELELKVGAQVMFVRNDTDHRFFNGMIGHVTQLAEDKVWVKPNDKADEEGEIEVERYEWQNVRYGLNEKTLEVTEHIDGIFIQFPLKLAWAITIHKSQGLTFTHVLLDASHAFAHGQTYVALSRCTTLKGIILTAPLPPSAIITDPYVLGFNEQMRQSVVSAERLEQMQNAYALQLISELFSFQTERAALAQVVRLLEEYLSNTYPETMKAFENCLLSFDSQVVDVASRFQRQYSSLYAENSNISSVALQERLTRGADYFAAQLTPLHQLAASTRLEVDNVQVKKRLFDSLTDLRHTSSVHIAILRDVATKGFHLDTFADLRARAEIDAEKTASATPEKKKKAKTKEEANYSVPTEVKNPALYQLLSAWRRQKANETGKAAYLFLQTKALIAISNYAPRTEAELLLMPYFGEKSLAAYGTEILSITNKWHEESGK